MFVNSFFPVLVYKKSITTMEWMLTLHANLSCPGCRAVGQMTTRGYPLNRSRLENIRLEVDQLATALSCGHCGILSSLPAHLRQKLLDDVGKIVTPEWIAKEKTQPKPTD